jgi:histidine decarboxylase
VTPARIAAGADLRELFDLNHPSFDLPAAIRRLRERHARERRHYLGFPVAYDLDFPETRRLQEHGFFNNISTERHWPPGLQHAMEAETAVLDWLSDLFGVDRATRWGHATTGGTGGNRAALRRARHLYPGAHLLYSTAAHYSVPRAADDFRIPATAVPARAGGDVHLDHLSDAVSRLTRARPGGDVPIVVVATWGTTVTEAADDLAGITAVLDAHDVARRYVHVDAALAGIPLALDGRGDLAGADSISVSGYKFLAVPEACGIVLGRGAVSRADRVIPYTATVDATETGVRSGLAPAMMVESIAQLGRAGHRARAHASRDLADYTITRLTGLGVPAWRNPGAYFTVVLPTPPAAVLATWTLANDAGGTSHIVCVPGVTKPQIDDFLTDLAAALP